MTRHAMTHIKQGHATLLAALTRARNHVPNEYLKCQCQHKSVSATSQHASSEMPEYVVAEG
eukprot:4756349-Amphidinium_carterae.1